MAFRVKPAKPVLSNRIAYPAILENLLVEPSRFPGGKDRLKWSFVITLPERPDCDYEVTAWTPFDFFQGSTEHTWASAALGHALPDDEEFDETDLIGAPVRLKVTPRTGNTPGTIFYNVEAVLPPASSEDSEAGMFPSPVTTPDKTDEVDVPF